MPEIIVKIGRFYPHWAIKVGEVWYEIRGPKLDKNKENKININRGNMAKSGAGAFGGEIVGTTDKTDIEISCWYEQWVSKNPDYHLLKDNCQKFAFDCMVWLTKNNYKFDHRVDAGNINTGQFWASGGFAVAQKGNAIAAIVLGQFHYSNYLLNAKIKVGQFSGQVVAGPGAGVFVDTTVVDLSVSFGNVIGIHTGLNVNTGIGIRNGDAELHLLGFGGKIGVDGVEFNTPIGGLNMCSVM